MIKFHRKTDRLYYRFPYASAATSVVTKVGADHLELAATVAYPEGGGQEADQGVIHLADGQQLRFIWAKKMYAHASGLPEFPGVMVDGVIWHMIHEEDRALLDQVAVGDEVTVEIDVERRAWLSLSHTASHLLYVGVELHRPDAVVATIGCHIKREGARFDFGVVERFSQAQIDAIAKSAVELAAADMPIVTESHPDVPDARVWRMGDYRIPCGGTHLSNSGPVGPMQVRRKSMGAGKERLACVFPEAGVDLSPYRPLTGIFADESEASA